MSEFSDNLRSGQTILFMDPFALSRDGLYRTPLFGGMANGIKIKVKKKKGNRFTIKLRKSR